MIGTYEYKVVNAIPPADYNNTAMTSDIISLKNYDHITFIINFGAVDTSAVTTTNLIAYKGKTVSAATTAFACKYRAELDAIADTLGTLTTLEATGIELGSGGDEDVNTGGGFIVIEIDAADLNPTIANPYDTVKISCTWDDQTSCIAGAVAILSRGRYKNAVMPTAITD